MNLRRPRFVGKAEHHLLWRIVAGAVTDALQAHPEYVTDRGRQTAINSITKRVVGQLVGHASEARKRRGFGPYQQRAKFASPLRGEPAATGPQAGESSLSPATPINIEGTTNA